MRHYALATAFSAAPVRKHTTGRELALEDGVKLLDLPKIA